MQHLTGKHQQGSMTYTQSTLRKGLKAAVITALLLPVAISTAKLLEAYLEHFYILQTIRLTITEPDLHTRSALQLKQDVVARLRLQGIDTLNAEQIDVSRHNAITQLHVQYSYKLTLLGNHVGTLHFDETFP